MKIILALLFATTFMADAVAATTPKQDSKPKRVRNHPQDANYVETVPLELPDNSNEQATEQGSKLASLSKTAKPLAAAAGPAKYSYYYRPQKFNGRKQLEKDLAIYNKSQWELVTCVVDDYIGTTGYDDGVDLRTYRAYPSYCLYRHFKGKAPYRINNRYSIVEYNYKSQFLSIVSEKNADGYELVTCVDSDAISYTAKGYADGFGYLDIYPAYYNATSYCVFKKPVK